MIEYSLRDAAAHGAEPTAAVMQEFIIRYLADHENGRRPEIIDGFLKAWDKAGGHRPSVRLQEIRAKKALMGLQAEGLIRQVAPKVWILVRH